MLLMARLRLLMLDEPSLGLAPRIVAEIFEVLERLKREGTSILVVKQSERPVFEIAHQVSVLERGRVAMTGLPAEMDGDEPRGLPRRRRHGKAVDHSVSQTPGF